jgi:hypothetical protein
MSDDIISRDVSDTEAAGQIVARDRHAAAGEIEAASAINAKLFAADVDPNKVDLRLAFPRPTSAAEAQERLRMMQGDPKIVDALLDPRNPLHRAVSAERDLIISALSDDRGPDSTSVRGDRNTVSPEAFKVHREGPPENWDHEAEGVLRHAASALGLDQQTFDQVLYSANTLGLKGYDTANAESATLEATAAMEKKYGAELPAMRQAFDEMLASLPAKLQEDVRFLLGETGLGNSVSFIQIALERAVAWKAARRK